MITVRSFGEGEKALAVDSFRATKGAARELFFKAQGCASSCRARGIWLFWARDARAKHNLIAVDLRVEPIRTYFSRGW